MTKLKKFLKYAAIILGIVIALFLILDNIIMPLYVHADEVALPDLVGKKKAEAISILEDLNLDPVIEEPHFDENFPKGSVILQKPRAGMKVKEGRRVYIYISGGEPLVQMPTLEGKTLRDAKITLERQGLIVGDIEDVSSDFPPSTVVGQDYPAGSNIKKGEKVNLRVSSGPESGFIRVPNLLGKSLSEAEFILKENSLQIGRIIYLESETLLPNTVYDQYPGEDKLVALGDSIDVSVTKAVSGRREN